MRPDVSRRSMPLSSRRGTWQRVTVFVVVVTGNHWWLDGIVAVAILVACAWAVHGVRTVWHTLRSSRRAPADPVPEPAPA